MKNILRLDGHTVDLAEDGVEGLKKVRETDYDIVFLDLKLPDKNGIDILREIKEVRLNILIIIITGYATIESAVTAIRLSAYDYILKPIEPQQIRQAIKNALKRRDIEAQIRKSIPPTSMLLIESEGHSLNYIKEKLMQEGMQTFSVVGEKAGLDYFRQNTFISCILLDISESESSPIDFLRKVRSYNPEVIFLPITNRPDISEALLMTKEGAYDYLVKPKDADELYSIIQQANQQQHLSFMNKQLIYEMQKINEKVSESENRFVSILRSVGDAVITTDNEGKIAIMNRVAEELTRVSFDKAVGKPVREILNLTDEDTGEPAGDIFSNVLKNKMKSSLYRDFIFKGDNDEKLPVSLRIDHIISPRGLTEGLVIVIRDISGRKEIERELVLKNRELDDFAFKVTHDLKNPLNLIRSWIDFINDDPEYLSKYLALIKKEAEKSAELIESILKLSRAGKVIEKKEEVELKELIKSLISVMKKNDVSLELIIDKDLPVINGDWNSVAQVFTNLIENSIKFHDPEKERLIIGVDGSIEDGCAIIRLKDNGMGIEEKNIGNIFAYGFTTHKQEGHGFGLVIVRKIMEAHDGSIEVQSFGKNMGTEFLLKFPM